MHSIDHKCVCNSFAALLVNGVHILLCPSTGPFGVGLVVFLRAGGIVSTRCTECTNSAYNVLDLMEFGKFPSIANIPWKKCGDEVHQRRTDWSFGFRSLTVWISNFPEPVLIKPCLKA